MFIVISSLHIYVICDSWRLYAGWSSPDLPYAGIVSLGGSMGAYEDAEYEWMPLEKKVLAEAVAAGA